MLDKLPLQASLGVACGLLVWSIYDNAKLEAKLELTNKERKLYKAKVDYLLTIMNREGFEVDEFDLIVLDALKIRVEIQEDESF
jgi:hypothetical protein